MLSSFFNDFFVDRFLCCLVFFVAVFDDFCAFLSIFCLLGILLFWEEFCCDAVALFNIDQIKIC